MEELKGYYDEGWNIEYIPPIIIDKEKGVMIDTMTSTSDIVDVLSTHELVLRYSHLSERYS